MGKSIFTLVHRDENQWKVKGEVIGGYLIYVRQLQTETNETRKIGAVYLQDICTRADSLTQMCLH